MILIGIRLDFLQLLKSLDRIKEYSQNVDRSYFSYAESVEFIGYGAIGGESDGLDFSEVIIT